MRPTIHARMHLNSLFTVSKMATADDDRATIIEVLMELGLITSNDIPNVTFSSEMIKVALVERITLKETTEEPIVEV